MIKRARMCERRQPSKGEKGIKVRRWDEKDDWQWQEEAQHRELKAGSDFIRR